MHIAVCDDDKDELEKISSILDDYKLQRKSSLSYRCFLSATEMLSTLKSGDYDLYFLDVLMPAVSGMDAAKEIRTFDCDAVIIFLTSSPEFAVESYRYRAYNYLLKPAKRDQMFQMLDSLAASHDKCEDGISVKTKSGISRILFDRIACVEVAGRSVFFHLYDGSTREVVAPLSEFEDVLLDRPEFMRTHRAYIVNLAQIAELNANGLTTLSGKHIPLSRQNSAKVRDAYVEQLFCRKGGRP